MRCRPGEGRQRLIDGRGGRRGPSPRPPGPASAPAPGARADRHRGGRPARPRPRSARPARGRRRRARTRATARRRRRRRRRARRSLSRRRGRRAAAFRAAPRWAALRRRRARCAARWTAGPSARGADAPRSRPAAARRARRPQPHRQLVSATRPHGAEAGREPHAVLSWPRSGPPGHTGSAEQRRGHQPETHTRRDEAGCGTKARTDAAAGERIAAQTRACRAQSIRTFVQPSGQACSFGSRATGRA